MPKASNKFTSWYVRTTVKQRKEMKARCKQIEIPMYCYIQVLHELAKKCSNVELIQMFAASRVAVLEDVKK